MFEQLTTRIRNLKRQQARHPRPRIIPILESLEDRCCPSTDAGGKNPDVWKPVDYGNYYSDPHNWTNGYVPVPGGPAIFDGVVARHAA